MLKIEAQLSALKSDVDCGLSTLMHFQIDSNTH